MLPVIDIFAGPGGLNEGFSKVEDLDGNPIFDIKGSFEMERRAVETLKLRGARRLFLNSPGASKLYNKFLLEESASWDALRPEFSSAFETAEKHVHEIELGEATRQQSDALIRRVLKSEDDFVLVGGPPCQAYSLVGRSRRAHDATFLDDKKHFLFKEYLHILEEFEPAVFVMENVKGLLSATHGNDKMFERIKEDLELDGTYTIRSLVVPAEQPSPEDFVIRAERYGVPQRRHRVILLGVRHDIPNSPRVLAPLDSRVTLHDVLADLTPIRSRLTHDDSQVAWEYARQVGRELARERLVELNGHAKLLDPPEVLIAGSHAVTLKKWLRVGEVPVSLHSSRAHMPRDVSRYAYHADLMAKGQRPRVFELPEKLIPEHRNVKGEGTPFADRFWVQRWDEPSSTIVSHLSKDGHHFIHPDPKQARSLSVREAARLQTFPDDYWFAGPRTKQFQQVGNAVPPYLAWQIGGVVAELLGHEPKMS